MATKRVRDSAGEHPVETTIGEGPGTEPVDGADEETTDELLAQLTGEPPASPQILSESPEPPAKLGAEDELLAALRAVGVRRGALEAELADVMVEMRTAIRAAYAGGIAKLAIASEAGVSRQTVYNVLASDD